MPKREKMEKEKSKKKMKYTNKISKMEMLEVRFRENEEKYKKNPRCEYCFFYAPTPTLILSKTIPGVKICNPCRQSEVGRNIDLSNDTRKACWRNRVRFPWPKHLPKPNIILENVKLERIEKQKAQICPKPRVKFVSFVERKFIANKKKYGHNPRCEYCYFHSSSDQLRQSESLTGVKICIPCRQAETARGVNLKKDTRTSCARNRTAHPWPSHLSAPYGVDEVSSNTEKAEIERKLKNLRMQMKINKAMRAHLTLEYDNALKPEESELLKRLAKFNAK
jgi:hypothetical protein